MPLKPKHVLLSGLVALAAPGAAQDLNPNLVFTSPNGARAVFYGQINLTYQGVDDGSQSYSNFVDNSNSTSRIGLRIDAPMGNNSFFFNLESGLGMENTAETGQTGSQSFFDWRRTDIRKFEIAYSGDFGKIWLGQGSMATDGAAEIDKSGTAIVGYSNIPDTAGSFQFRSGGALSGLRVGQVFGDFDGGRRMRIRYDTPKLAGFYASAAYGDEVLNTADTAEYYDLALRYGLEEAAVAFDAAFGYSWKRDNGVMTEYLIASGSALHKPSGLNVTIATGSDRTGTADYRYAKLGWRKKVLAIGETALSVDYFDGRDYRVAGSDSTSWGGAGGAACRTAAHGCLSGLPGDGISGSRHQLCRHRHHPVRRALAVLNRVGAPGRAPRSRPVRPEPDPGRCLSLARPGPAPGPAEPRGASGWPGTKVTSIRTSRISAMNGSTAAQIVRNRSRNPAIATDRFTPSGGVRKPISRLITSITPNCAGRIPKAAAAGPMSGARTRIAGIGGDETGIGHRRRGAQPPPP